jgi:hypothetical protein
LISKETDDCELLSTWVEIRGLPGTGEGGGGSVVCLLQKKVEAVRGHPSLAASALSLSGQLIQQRLRLLQVFGIKAFGEPVVNLG